MRREYLTSLLLAGAVALPLLGSGCAEHRYARVYDPYYHEYHRWGPDEDRYYRQWEVEGHRDHRDWGRRSPEQQKEYWGWRHHHGDHHDRDHDHDRDHNRH